MTQDKFERELSHRERAMIFRSSSIFDGQGMSDSTCYDPLRQREILRGEKQKADMKFQPQLGNEHPKDVKATQNSGHGLIMGDQCASRDREEREVIPVVRAGPKSDEFPRECWKVPDSFFKNANSDNRMGWSDQRLQRARNQIPRDKNGKLSPRTGQYDQKFGGFNADVRPSHLKAHELSSDMFSHPRNYNYSPRGLQINQDDLQSASADFLQARTDAQLREQRERNAEMHINASDRWQRNLHGEHHLRTKQELNLASKMEPAEDPRRGYEKNYSDLFSNGNVPAPAKIKQREEAVGTHGISWLDSRAEIAVRNLNHHSADGCHSAKERKNREFGNDHIIFETERQPTSPRGFPDCSPESNIRRLKDEEASRNISAKRDSTIAGPYGGAAPYTGKKTQEKTHLRSAKSRRYQELAGAGFLNSLADEEFAGESMNRNESGHERNKKQKTHGHQKIYYDAVGGIGIGPKPNEPGQAAQPIVYSTSQRKYQELKGQIGHGDM